MCDLMSHLHTSTVYTLKKNKELLRANCDGYCKLLANIEKGDFSQKDEAAKHANDTLKQLACSVHHCKEEYRIVDSMGWELDYFRNALQDGSGVDWESP